MPRPALRATALYVLLLAIVGAVPGFAVSKEFNQSYPLQPGGSLELQNVNGTVDVEGWDRNEIEVHAVKTAKHKESDLERVFIQVDAPPVAISIALIFRIASGGGDGVRPGVPLKGNTAKIGLPVVCGLHRAYVHLHA